ncbi:TPA: LOW QUALITY PROTEIN: hypothetical protein N0F65_003605 [Lagenidium giganteum]|uniref:Acetyl-CoA C-acetyltransferase n=1 Tax=Lagenidium giganteum TaxID=4803 RepID=A0AAV2Z330_9STRA|nr:TPA: LOW QUALITY PROTEIN: hypothetical protein N0F65_003605 [Lagenidium giganteum]
MIGGSTSALGVPPFGVMSESAPKKARVMAEGASTSTNAARDVCIVGVARTPVGSFQGNLASLSAPELAGKAIHEALKRAGVQGDQVEEVILGNVVSAGLGQSPAKQASTHAGLPPNVVASSVNKVCASGMKALIFGSQSIMLGVRDVVVVGGMESMSQAPHMSNRVRSGARFGELVFTDSLQTDGLMDAAEKVPMGDFAEQCAERYNISRADQDAHAAESYRRSRVATEKGKFKEIVPVEVTVKRGAPPKSITEDEEVMAREVTVESMGKLRPCFKPSGDFGATVTAGNASPISDGAAALVLMSRERVNQLNLGDHVLAVVRGFGDAEQEAPHFTTSPSLAIPNAVKRAGLQLEDIDFCEINEAFSVVALANMKILKLDPAKVNAYGGAVSIGHPLGCSGARIVTTLCSVLQQESGKYGCAAVCNGGGGASAVVIELRRDLGVRSERVENDQQRNAEQGHEHPIEHVLDTRQPGNSDSHVTKRTTERACFRREQTRRHVDTFQDVGRDEDDDATEDELHRRVVAVADDQTNADEHHDLRHDHQLAIIIAEAQPADDNVGWEHEQAQRREVEARLDGIPLEVVLRNGRRAGDQTFEHQLEHNMTNVTTTGTLCQSDDSGGGADCSSGLVGLAGFDQAWCHRTTALNEALALLAIRFLEPDERGNHVERPENEHDPAWCRLDRHHNAEHGKVWNVVEGRSQGRAGRHTERTGIVGDVATVNGTGTTKTVEQTTSDGHADAVVRKRETVEQVANNQADRREDQWRLVRAVGPPTVEHGTGERGHGRHTDNHTAESSFPTQRSRVVTTGRRHDVVVGHVQERAEMIDKARRLGHAHALERLVPATVLTYCVDCWRRRRASAILFSTGSSSEMERVSARSATSVARCTSALRSSVNAPRIVAMMAEMPAKSTSRLRPRLNIIPSYARTFICDACESVREDKYAPMILRSFIILSCFLRILRMPVALSSTKCSSCTRSSPTLRNL